MVTWIPSIYPLYVSIYTSTMDPMGYAICISKAPGLCRSFADGSKPLGTPGENHGEITIHSPTARAVADPAGSASPAVAISLKDRWHPGDLTSLRLESSKANHALELHGAIFLAPNDP